MAIHIQNEPDAPGKDLLHVIQNLERYNTEQASAPFRRRTLRLFARDDDGRIMGGLFAQVTMGWLAIQILWLEDELRGKGVGRQLLEEAEGLAKESEAIGAYVETTNFQARPFYEGMGYVLFAELEDCPPGDVTYFLKKRWS